MADARLRLVFRTLGARGDSRARERVSYVSSILLREALPLVDRPPAGFVPREKPLVPRVGFPPKFPIEGHFCQTILASVSRMVDARAG